MTTRKRRITTVADRARLRDASYHGLGVSLVDIGEEIQREAARLEKLASLPNVDGTRKVVVDQGFRAHLMAHSRARLQAIADELAERIRLLDAGKEVGP